MVAHGHPHDGRNSDSPSLDLAGAHSLRRRRRAVWKAGGGEAAAKSVMGFLPFDPPRRAYETNHAIQSLE